MSRESLVFSPAVLTGLMNVHKSNPGLPSPGGF